MKTGKKVKQKLEQLYRTDAKFKQWVDATVERDLEEIYKQAQEDPLLLLLDQRNGF